jgi:hypothetical protein
VQLTFTDSYAISYLVMSAREWLAMRGIELLAALFVAFVLILGLVAGVPILRSRIAEVILYSLACVAAVILRSALDLAAHGILWLASHVGVATGLRAIPEVRPAA